MIQIINSDGATINRSANLRGLRSYAGKYALDCILVTPYPTGQCTVEFRFHNGARCVTDWASVIVLAESLKNWRNVYGAYLFVSMEETGKVSKSGNWWLDKTARF